MNTSNRLAKIAVIFMIACLCFAFVGCDFNESKNNFYGGEILDDSVLESIRDALMSNETSSPDIIETTENSDETDAENVGDETDITVYWIENGSVWHLYEDCGYVDGRECTSGSIAEAQKAGKERVCHTCEKKAEQETTEATTTEPLVTESDTTEVIVIETTVTETELTETTVTESVVETIGTEPDTSEPETTEPETTEPETTEADDGTVYWIENGSVWHNDVNCQHIKGKEVISGSVEDAIEAGKQRLCRSCEK